MSIRGIAQWNKLPISDSAFERNNVVFLNKDTGFITTISAGKNVYLFRTLNASSNSQLIDSSTYWAAPITITKLIVMRRTYPKGFPLCITTDGGKTFDTIAGASKLVWPFFITQDIGFAGYDSGGWLFNPLYKTKDGGKTWYEVSKELVYLQGGIVFPSDTMTGYAEPQPRGVDSTILLRTTDAGETWQRVYQHKNKRKFPNSTWSRFIYLTDKIIVHITDSFFYKSRDGGLTWNKTTDFTFDLKKQPQGIYFKDSLHGYFTSYSKGVYCTVDGGKNWSMQDPIPMPPRNFQFINFSKQLGYLWGKGDIYMTTNGGGFCDTVTSVNSSTNKPNELLVYPNPARHTLTIKSTQSITAYQLIDITGRILAKDESLNQLQTEINVSQLPQGIYQLMVQTKEGMVVKKVVVR